MARAGGKEKVDEWPSQQKGMGEGTERRRER
jgi:hypothetical protein